MGKNRNLKPVSMAVKLMCLGALTTAPAHIAFANDEAIEKIEVTGSRIMREGAIAPSPVSVLSGQDLVNTGALNIGEALNKLPSLKPTFGMQNSGRFIGTSGLNVLDLRGMGEDRTLVLVNGKRHVASSGGSALVDTNTIPTAWVDRVEVITGGASAIYGADAVTGVVNFILKKNIEGFSVAATHGEAENSDYDNQKFSISFGQDFSDGRGNFGISYEFATQSRLNALDNEFTNHAVRELTNFERDPNRPDALDNPDEKFYDNAGFFNLTESGVFNAGGIYYTFNEDGSPRPMQLDYNKLDGLACVDCEFLNLRKFTEIQPSFDRHIVNFKTNYDINDDTNIYLEGKFASIESENWGQPSFHTRSGITLSRDNAFLHPQTAQIMDSTLDDEGNPLTALRINRFNEDIGRRFEISTRETTRFVLGIEGVVAEDWDYEVFLNSGTTEIERANHNNLVRPNFQAAIDAVFDDNGNVVCRDAQARANGCEPMDIMGFNRPSQESINYVNTVSVGTVKVEQLNAGASLANGGLFELPAGPVGVAFGVEYREEKSRQREDENAKSGETFFNSLGEDEGEYDVSEVFFETSIPLLGDVLLVDTLTLELASRYADYSTVGDVTSWKVGLDWQVYDDLRFRSTLAEAIRAPNIGELFGATSETFYGVDDPCRVKNLNQVTGATQEQRKANCAALGVPAGFDDSYDSARIRGAQSGNKELTPEESTSYTIGAVFTPEFVDGLTFTVDYWNIELEDSISYVLSQQIVNRCVDAQSIDNQYCALITRADDGRMTLIKNTALNIAKQKSSGVDFEINYDVKTSLGDFKTRLMATRLIERQRFPFQDEVNEFEEYAGVDTEPSWSGALDIGYEYENVFASWKMRYVEKTSRFRPDELEKNPNPSNHMEWPTYIVTDISGGYNFDNGMSVKLGIDNLFNKEMIKYTTGTTLEGGTYDNIGRFGYVQLSYKF
ncbi:TonB-dependent receptor domain-containing protein [Pseudoalteromonas umbrosa]|uniref:TonB-dependent receptor domain-containing protein n=1 Tax=Pseudoalteromonas umbrosa TaxID=3048489 RepID=UPI0024C21DCC|nr:TonB-dependent receptor [Pseudoalteromonas sp. B95]MDK1286817.1 TonB-dependent receptor [Pseudoalteromonas sp. B95]